MAEKKLGGINQRPDGFNRRPVQGTGINQRPQKAPEKPFVKAGDKVPVNKENIKPAVSGAPDDKEMTGAESVISFVNALIKMVEPFALVNADIIKENVDQMVGAGTMTYEDRTVSYDCVNYVMSNMAYILSGLIMQPAFKTEFVNAVYAEKYLDTVSTERKAELRKAMTNPNKPVSRGSIVLGETQFAQKIEENLKAKMGASFDTMSRFDSEVAQTAAALDNEYKLELGYVFSNWMYLIRAFNKNDDFMGKVISVIEDFKAEIRKIG